MKQEKVYVDPSEASSSKESVLRGDEEDEEEELELGLSLKVAGGKSKAGAWGDRCRILPAKDFLATPGSRASPPSSSSSVSSSSDDTKRVADPSASANPPSQMVVGWPPIRAFRMNSLVNQAKDNNTSDVDAITNKKNSHNLDSSSNNKNNINECVNNKNQEKQTASARCTRFVKVNMDGDPIGRKVNLNTHQSYETLAVTLEIMFYDPTTALCSSSYSTKASKLLDGSADYALTYEDKDGDWMLVGDVPWGMFLDTVKRLRIMRTSDANGLATRFQSSASGILRSKHA